MKKVIFIWCCIILSCLSLYAQTDDAASAQHLILGQKAAGAGSTKTRMNSHPDAQ